MLDQALLEFSACRDERLKSRVHLCNPSGDEHPHTKLAHLIQLLSLDMFDKEPKASLV